MAPLRLIRAAALALVCLGAFACSGALAQPAHAPSAKALTAHLRLKHARHTHACARRASYHAHSRKHRCKRRRSHRHLHRSPGKTHHSGTGTPQPKHTSAADLAQCPGATLTPSPSNVGLVREATLCLVNRERVAHGESALTPDPALERSSQSHSESMAANAYFEHTGPGDDSPLSRMRANGYLSGAQGFEVGENIAWGTLWLGSPRAIVAGWMASPGHRANILDAHFRDTGVGVAPHVPRSWAHGQAGGIYTQDFGVRG